MLFDKEGTGEITFENLKAIAKELGWNSSPKFSDLVEPGETMTDDELKEMILEANHKNK